MNALIGFLIVLAAWLVVDTLMRGLVGSDGVVEGWGPWSQVQCWEQVSGAALPEISDGIGGELTGTLPDGSPACGPSDPLFPDCVPPTPADPTGACEPLRPLTGAAVAMEGGARVVWAGADPRLQACASAAGGTVVSAYRPTEYQSHLREVHTKWCSLGLRNNTDPACASVRGEVSREMSNHGLSCSRPVARNSNHSSGIAVDISGAPQRDMPEHCLDWFGPGDPVHYTLMPGCSC